MMKEWVKVLVRFLVAVVVPPVLGLLIMVVVLDGFDQGLSGSIKEIADDLPFLVRAAFVFTLIPSLCAFSLFEFVLSKRIRSIASYALLGGLFGFVSGLFMLYVINGQIWPLHPVNLVGSVVGIVIGSVFYFLYRTRNESIA